MQGSGRGPTAADALRLVAHDLETADLAPPQHDKCKDQSGQPGFEFRFSRGPASSGYVSASSEAYSVYRLRLDVRPVALGWPAYRPFPAPLN